MTKVVIFKKNCFYVIHRDLIKIKYNYIAVADTLFLFSELKQDPSSGPVALGYFANVKSDYFCIHHIS